MEIKASEFEGEVIKQEGKVLVDFFASWCLPCKTADEVLNQLEKTTTETKIVKINVDKNPSLRERYNIMGLPTFILFQNGEESGRKVGSLSREQLEEFIGGSVHSKP